ncbi:MAG: aerotolerance regulator BatB [Bacteroidia bacterium]|nr:MAG: aerotolerance regulator BatB [Bacteroidia bacterium]
MNFVFGENLFFLIILLPLLLGLVYWVYRRSNFIIPYYFDIQKIQYFHPPLKAAIRSLCLFFIAIALLGPYFEGDNQLVPIINKEIIFLLDVSASMNCEDVQPSRLKKAKKEIKKIVQRMQGSKMGLIVFTSFPYVQCPLTNDPKAIEMFLDLLETNQFANTGTDFRKALAKAAERFTPDSLSKGASKSIILISDGEDFGEKYTSVIELLKQLNIKVYCVGIGTTQGSKIPHPDGGFFLDNNQKLAVSKLNNQSLKSIAQRFQTPYYELQTINDHLDELADQLEKEKFTVLGVEEQIKQANLYQWFLLPGWILLLITHLWIPVQKENL